MRGKLWMMMRELERGEVGRIRVEGKYSETRAHRSGLGQGGRLPPIKWGFAINPLLEALTMRERSGVIIGTEELGTHKIAARGFYDDVHGVEGSAKELADTFKTAEEKGEETMMTISPEKSHVMRMGERKEELGIEKWNIRGHEITDTNEIKIVGEWVSQRMGRCKKQISETLEKARTAAAVMVGIGGIGKGATVRVGKALFNALVQQAMVEGLMISTLTRKEWKTVEAVKTRVMRKLAGLTSLASAEAVARELAYYSIEGIVGLRLAEMMWQFLRGQAGEASRVLAVVRIQEYEENGDSRTGPIISGWKWARVLGE